ncbi:dephospho-CoA kinase [Chloroflexota bacterium]
MTKVIGLTGGIGSGKSTVSRFLMELGAMIIDADKVGHEAYEPNTETWREIVAAFGDDIVTLNGEIDRKKLGEIVFTNPQALSWLNQIMHPRLYDITKVKIEEHRHRGVDVVVLEAALLIEANWTSLVDEVWVIIGSETKVIERVKKQRGLVNKQTLARLRSQLPQEERVKHADVVINNDGDLDELRIRVNELWERLKR